MSSFDWISMGAKTGILVLVMLQVVPIMVWVERRGSALMQNRIGPNRVGPLGLLQSLADVVKFLAKEDFVPQHVDKFYYLLAPAVLLIPAFMTFAVIPFGGTLTLGEHTLNLQVADLDVGLLYIFSIASLGVYGIIMAGWASNNKYSLLGSLRSSAQMISYELSLGLSAIGIIMVFGTVSLKEIAAAQSGFVLPFVPNWGVVLQPVGFLIFLTAVFAETNRLPFDLPEGESEIVAGYHLEYGSMKFALFFMAEYLNMMTASALITTLYFGGYNLPGLEHAIAPFAGLLEKVPMLAPYAMEWARGLLQVGVFTAKVGFFMWFFVWVRWTLPRFRYDQLMDLGWKVMLPLALANLAVTAVLIYYKVI